MPEARADLARTKDRNRAASRGVPAKVVGAKAAARTIIVESIMAPRAYWKGHVRLSLVSFPVQLIPAIDSKERVTFHRVHKQTGQRVRYQSVVPDKGPVENEEIGKGYEYEKGRFVVIEDEEINKLKLESSHTLDIVQFVESNEIGAAYYEKPYFVLPDGAFAEDAFRVVRDAMRDTKKVALGQIVLSSRERIAALMPCERGLLLETLRYHNEVREASRYFAEIRDGQPEGEQLELAKQLIKMKSAPFEPEKFKDHYQSALHELVAAKLQGREPRAAAAEAGGPKVINLMDALKRSLKTDERGKETPEPVTKPPAPSKRSRSAAKKAGEGEPSRRSKTSA
jgi:DNA end-binding protein Ku